ncbi:sensor histidine kinase [Ferrimonas sp. SCSIO 43195]|nr:sensor histidine kinase [Ferrimonas sp. SCSIO 43195]
MISLEALELILNLTQQMSLYLVIAYIFTKTPVFRPLVTLSHRLPHRLMLYVVFSCFCILGTYFGEQTNGAIANTRAMGAVLAGLLGGPLTGFAVGLTGGLHRYSLGGFTDVACAISTTCEGLSAGLVHAYLIRRGRMSQLFRPGLVAMVAFWAEVMQMLIILMVARPLPEAWALVKIIAPPMLLVNTVGAAMFMSMLRDQRAMVEKMSSAFSTKALKIAERTVGILSQGFNPSSTKQVARIIYEETQVGAVAITDRHKLLAFIGIGSDHHLPDTPISSSITEEAIRHNQVMFADGLELKYTCSLSPNCPLGSSLVIPLRGENEVIGTIKLYEAKNKLFLNINRTLGEGIAKLLSNQILHGRYQHQSNLLTQAELKLLQAQVNPHFLFNALNTVAAVTRSDANRARELIQNLATFLRGNLKRGTGEVSLSDELQHIDAYLEIEQARFGDRLSVTRDIDQQALHLKLPTFTLQPLVENAVKHGVAHLFEPGRIRLSARIDQQQLLLTVEDNAGAYQPKPEGDGLGMSLVDKRIKAQYGRPFGISVECQPQQFTRVTVTLPAVDALND